MHNKMELVGGRMFKTWMEILYEHLKLDSLDSHLYFKKKDETRGIIGEHQKNNYC